jgi:hypothetical protein
MPRKLLEQETAALAKWARTVRTETSTAFETASKLVRRLGAHLEDGHAVIGFWTPELSEKQVAAEKIFLEVFIPPQDLDLHAAAQTLTFQRKLIPLVQDEDYLWGVIEGMQAGTRDIIGDLYWVVYQTQDGEWHSIVDHLAYSVPFGVKGPSEFYDFAGMLAGRRDKAHFANLDVEPRHAHEGVQRIAPPVNILQIHPGTNSAEGTLDGLTRIYATIADKINNNEPLSPAEENYIGYDAIELMPIEPPIEHEAGPLFWEMHDTDRSTEASSVKVTLRQHDIIDWGYDVMISGSTAVNPSVLSSKRPDELLELIETLHQFPGKPIKVMFDIVYGHTDNQAIGILNDHYLAGANMYGQNMNYLSPVVRAILLEMQRRKHNYGVDGIRVDGAQDFKWWDPGTDTMIHDDDYLRLMNNTVQEVDGNAYLPWMIFEDGRPWPREDWELASTYRELTKQMPNIWQWGPLTFAHNTPFLFTFWISKWWRIQEMTQVGSKWITGCANHDTLRRGAQVPIDARVNTYLGDTLPEIIENAYDNAAAKLFDYAMMPGVPMDFVQGSMRAPWGFIRNTDDRYGVKVMSEEAPFTYWRITAERYSQPEHYQRMKNHGFATVREVRRYITHLDHTVQATHNDLPVISDMLNSVHPHLAGRPFTVAKLKAIARDWMEDTWEYCNVRHYWDDQNPIFTGYNLKLREFRRARPWLMNDLRGEELLDFQRPADGTVLFYGVRVSPDGDEKLIFIANMEGAPRKLTPARLPIPDLDPVGWEIAIHTPGLTVGNFGDSVMLEDSQGVVFRKTISS